MSELRRRQPWRLWQLWRLYELWRVARLWRIGLAKKSQLQAVAGAAAAMGIICGSVALTCCASPTPKDSYPIKIAPVTKPLPPNYTPR
ncbi:hypothetical protein NDR87_35835 [Nocardia sp. CDC159]|uniref:Uncharacterized protein n=1 Tax=Nocardia pulmonis TaxID=2951408 RepID=A0A9X2EDF9_9NOCA|nr:MULTISPECIES: hypothetical protein [Nocardia]MCM6778859.1 hypothetical protein [Nocardia pulmonis]MCM6791748.1 hypothetical protein [Nocardia sp. CDC159]